MAKRKGSAASVDMLTDVGGTVEMVRGLQRVPKAEGLAAAKAGQPRESNPYPRISRMYSHDGWDQGWSSHKVS